MNPKCQPDAHVDEEIFYTKMEYPYTAYGSKVLPSVDQNIPIVVHNVNRKKDLHYMMNNPTTSPGLREPCDVGGLP